MRVKAKALDFEAAIALRTELDHLKNLALQQGDND
jgi:hypothetical protein